MLANALIFLLGLFVAALAALIVSPLVWRKAQSLARREFEATIPISANEIRAEFDRVRAEAALSVRRQEILTAETRTKAALAEAERGRSTVENTEILKRNRRLTKTVEEKEEELAGTRAILAARDEDYGRLSKQLAAVRHDAELTSQELEALARRFRDLGEIAEERKIQLIASEARIERLSDTIRASDRIDRDGKTVIEKLEGEIAGLERILRQERAGAATLQEKVADLVGRLADREEELSRHAPAARPAGAEDGAAAPGPSGASRARDLRSEPATTAAPNGSARLKAALARRGADADGVDGAAEADIRERISDIAARVIRMTALAEGPESPLAGLLAAPASRSPEPREAGRPSLAERVRLLADAERQAGA